MRIKYPQAIQENEEDSRETRTALTRTESSGSGAHAAPAQKGSRDQLLRTVRRWLAIVWAS
jgi:hypothetical protein